jgi:hypothetical protein
MEKDGGPRTECAAPRALARRLGDRSIRRIDDAKLALETTERATSAHCETVSEQGQFRWQQAEDCSDGTDDSSAWRDIFRQQLRVQQLCCGAMEKASAGGTKTLASERESKSLAVRRYIAIGKA